ncbi:MAG: arsenate reductase ArsC [Bacteriovoracales bacterium]
MTEKLNVLFLCTGNSCRSQMAEGWCRFLKNKTINAFSAGTISQGLNPHALDVMRESGVDISNQKSKTVDELPSMDFDLVITLCEDASKNCPYFPGKKVIHFGFDDPPKLTKNMENKEEVLKVYKRVRDEIKNFITDLEKYL